MSTDISRKLFQPAKHYSGVSIPQGVPATDFTFNEAEMIDDEVLRQVVLDVVGPCGTGNDGFKIAKGDPDWWTTLEVGPGNPDYLRFEIGAGHYYIGGLRFQSDEVQEFRLQRNWIQGLAGSPAAVAPDSAAEDLPAQTSRAFLVVLEGWEQPVTGVEDHELLEPALGGVDTGARLRRMHRVKLLDTLREDCSSAWGEIQGNFGVNPEGLIESPARLKVDLVLGSEPEDLCKPDAVNGYAGGENQAIRVMATGPKSFVWGFNNSAPLYRVKVTNNVITMVDQPKDQVAQPLAGQIVELLPVSAVLPNGQKVAEEVGVFSHVTVGYDPDSRQLEVQATDPTADFISDLTHYGATVPTIEKDISFDTDYQNGAYFFMRVWDRGSALVSDDGDIALTFTDFDGPAISLGSTGLTIEQRAEDANVGDFWVIAARPDNPEQVVPWALQLEDDGDAPCGPKKYMAPLAYMIAENDGTTIDITTFEDCRKTFDPLIENNDCCTFKVGDGTQSHGDFDNIQSAVDALSDTEGGTICVLPGEYAPFTISGKRCVKIRGCGKFTRIINDETVGNTSGVLIENSTDIAVCNLYVESIAHCIVVIEDPQTSPKTEDLRLEDLRLKARDALDGSNDPVSPAATCVLAFGTCGLRVERCRAVQTSDLFTPEAWPVMSIAGDDTIVDRCVLESFRPNDDVLSRLGKSTGGLHIASNSDDFTVRFCLIRGGGGHGVSLGTLAWAPEDAPDPTQDPNGFVASTSIQGTGAGAWAGETSDGCSPPAIDPWVSDRPNGDDTLTPVNLGDLHNIRILHNVIVDCGGSGISAAAFWPLAGVLEPTESSVPSSLGPNGPYMVTTDDLLIQGNQIIGCLRGTPTVPTSLRIGSEDAVRWVGGTGAIALADGSGVEIRENVISRNSPSVIAAACGIFVARADGLKIMDNRIEDTGVPQGEEDVSEDSFQPGPRGGVVVSLAGRWIVDGPNLGLTNSVIAFPARLGEDTLYAAQVRGNLIRQPEGRCLDVFAWGPVAVEGNQMATNGLHVLGEPGSAVRIWNWGVSPDLAVPKRPCEPLTGDSGTIADAMFQVTQGLKFTRRTETPVSAEDEIFFHDGRTLFNDNQVSTVLNNPPGSPNAQIAGPSHVDLRAIWDDVSVVGNQIKIVGLSAEAVSELDSGSRGGECPFLQWLWETGNAIDTNLHVLAWTTRVVANRFEETFSLQGETFQSTVNKSAETCGFSNVMSDNIGTHCLLGWNWLYQLPSGYFTNEVVIDKVLPFHLFGHRVHRFGREFITWNAGNAEDIERWYTMCDLVQLGILEFPPYSSGPAA